jgi:DNA-directed RNA polymerase specialized sigma24 family protein
MTRAGTHGTPTEFSWAEEFVQFYLAHRSELVDFARSIGRRKGLAEAQFDAEGIAQDTFEEAIRKWPTIERPERWIYTVARRKLAARRRGNTVATCRTSSSS